MSDSDSIKAADIHIIEENITNLETPNRHGESASEKQMVFNIA